MTSPRSLVIGTTLLVVGLVLRLLLGAGPTGSARSATPLTAGLTDPNRAHEVRVLRALPGAVSTTRTFRRDAEGWVHVEQGGYPADAALLRDLLEGLTQAGCVQALTARPDRHAALGLEVMAEGATGTRVDVFDVEGARLASVILGRPRRAAGEPQSYARRTDEDATWIVDRRFDLPADGRGWIDARILELGQERIVQVLCATDDGSLTVLERGDGPDGALVVRDVPTDRRLRPGIRTVPQRAALRYLALDDVATRAERPLPADGRWVTTYTTVDGLEIALTTAPDPAALDREGVSPGLLLQVDVVTVSGEVTPESDRLRAGTAPWTYTLAPGRGSALRFTLEDFLEPLGDD